MNSTPDIIDPTEKYSVWTLALVVGALTFALFSPCLRYGFVNLDDAQYIHHNVRVSAGITVEGLRAAFSVFNGEYWLPVLFLSFMADAQVFGVSAWAFHLVNVLLHAANAALVFLLLRTAARRVWPAFAAATVFAVHPLRVESVVWISQRKDVLSTFFVLLALAAWRRYAHDAQRDNRRHAWYGLTLLLLILGLMTKPMLVTFPVLLLVLDFWPLGRFRWSGTNPSAWWRDNRRLVWEKMPLLAVCLAFSAATLFNQKAHLATEGGWAAILDPLVRAPLSYFIYMGKMILPLNLGLEFRHPDPVPPVAQGVAALVAHTAILLFLWKQRRPRPYLLAGWLWYLVCLFPISGIVPVGLQWISDRFTYVPALGISVALVWWIASLMPGVFQPRTAIVVTTAVILALGAGTLVQMRFWRDSKVLFRRSILIAPESPRAYFVFGSALARVGRLEEALAAMEAAVRRAPDDFIVGGGFANVLADMGNRDEAISILDRHLAARPDSLPLLKDLARIRGEKGDWEGRSKNLAALIPVVRTKREKALVSDELAKTLWILGRKDEALARFREAVDYRPTWPIARFDFGLALLRMGMPEMATEQFEAFSVFRKSSLLGEVGVAESLFAAGRVADARDRFNLVSARSEEPESVYARGRIAESDGRVEQAEFYYRRALAANNNPDLVRLMQVGLGARFEGLMDKGRAKIPE